MPQRPIGLAVIAQHVPRALGTELNRALSVGCEAANQALAEEPRVEVARWLKAEGCRRTSWQALLAIRPGCDPALSRQPRNFERNPTFNTPLKSPFGLS